MTRPLYIEVLYGTISNASSSGAAGRVNIPVIDSGFIVKAWATSNIVNASAAVALPLSINGSTTNLSNGSMTLASSGTVGEPVTATPSGLRDVVEDDFISVQSDGGSTVEPLKVNVAVLIRR